MADANKVHPLSTQEIRVILADDHELVIEGLTTRLNSEDDMQVVATASGASRLMQTLAATMADVIVLDLHMDGDDGFSALAQIRQQALPVKVLILTALTDGATLQRAMELDADGIVLKTDPTRRVVEAIRAVADGQVVYPRALHRALLRRSARSQEQAPTATLTARENDVMALLAKGLTNAEIANRLGLSSNTVKYHIQNIYGKLGVSNRTEATRRYLEE